MIADRIGLHSVLLPWYSKPLNNWSHCGQWISPPRISMLLSGTKIHCSPRDQSLTVKYLSPYRVYLSYKSKQTVKLPTIMPMFKLIIVSTCIMLFPYFCSGESSRCVREIDGRLRKSSSNGKLCLQCSFCCQSNKNISVLLRQIKYDGGKWWMFNGTQSADAHAHYISFHY